MTLRASGLSSGIVAPRKMLLAVSISASQLSGFETGVAVMPLVHGEGNAARRREQVAATQHVLSPIPGVQHAVAWRSFTTRNTVSGSSFHQRRDSSSHSTNPP